MHSKNTLLNTICKLDSPMPMRYRGILALKRLVVKPMWQKVLITVLIAVASQVVKELVEEDV